MSKKFWDEQIQEVTECINSQEPITSKEKAVQLVKKIYGDDFRSSAISKGPHDSTDEKAKIEKSIRRVCLKIQNKGYEHVMQNVGPRPN